jgi:hypothetical protein
VSEATHPDLIGNSLGWGEGTTEADLWTALRFALGRPGWRVEPRSTAQGRAYLRLATAHRRNGRQRLWRMDRSQDGLLVHDKASGRRLGAVPLPTVREALVRVWEAANGAGPGD